MSNPLFIGLVTYVIQLTTTASFDEFEEAMMECLDDLKSVEEMEDVAWWEDLQEHWEKHWPKSQINEVFDSFKQYVTYLSIEDLCILASLLRNTIMLESLSDLTYPVQSLRAVYHIKWEDGSQVECAGKHTARRGLDQTGIGELSDAYEQSFIDMIVDPGLDTLHDQLGTVYDMAKFDELTQLMRVYVNQKPAGERDEYTRLINRFVHIYKPEPVTLANENNKRTLKWLEGKGGF